MKPFTLAETVMNDVQQGLYNLTVIRCLSKEAVVRRCSSK